MELNQNSTERSSTLPDHEHLFDEICGKLQELSHRNDTVVASDRFEKMHNQLRRSHDELKQAQIDIQEKIKSMDTVTFATNDLSREVKRLSEQLEQERLNNSKLSTDLAKSLELNLRLQFEVEEVRSKGQQIINEEKKHNQFLIDKNKAVNHELDLSQALANENRLELIKAKDKFQSENQAWNQERNALKNELNEKLDMITEKDQFIIKVQSDLTSKIEEIQAISETLFGLEAQTHNQNEMMKNLTHVAEKKLIELKLALDKKTIESQDYYSHLNQAMTQINVLRQENSALKEYISKLASLHQSSKNA